MSETISVLATRAFFLLGSIESLLSIDISVL